MNLRRWLFFLCMSMLVLVGTGQAAPFGYVSDSYNDWVFVLDLGAETFAAKVSVGNAPTGVAVSPDGTRVYVANRDDDSISAINSSDNTIFATFPVDGTYPLDVAVAPDGSTIYTAYTEKDYIYRSYLAEMSASTGALSAEVELVGNKAATLSSVVVSPDGQRIYVADKTNNVVYVVRNSDFALIATLPVGKQPRGVAVSPDNARVYVTNEDDGSVTIIDAAGLKVTKTVQLPAGLLPAAPWDVAVNPSGANIYVTDSANERVLILSSQGDVGGTIAVGVDPRGIDFNVEGSRAFVANHGADTISVVDTSSNSTIKTIDLDQGAVGGLESIDLSDLSAYGILAVTSPIVFSDTQVGSTISRDITLANRGGGDLQIGNIGNIDSLGAPFTITNDSCSNKLLGTGAVCSLSVSCAPSAAGEYIDFLDIPYTAETSGSNLLELRAVALAPGNSPPTSPSLLLPANGEAGVSTSTVFRWTRSSDSVGDTVTYKLYYSTDPSFSATQPKMVASLFDQRVLLAGGGIASLLALLIGLPGAVQSRRRILVLIAALIAATLLSAACGGGGGGETGTAPVTNSPNEASTMVSGLSAGVKYYWKVVADDGKEGGQRSSEIWSFTTAK